MKSLFELKRLTTLAGLKEDADVDVDTDTDTDTDTDVDTDVDVDDDADTSIDSDSESNIMPLGLVWEKYDSRFAVLPFDTVFDITSTLLNGETAKSRHKDFENSWDIEGLARYIFGNLGQHGYSDSGTFGLEVHPKLRLLMLPPSWTLAMSVLMNKSDTARYEIQKYAELVDGELSFKGDDSVEKAIEVAKKYKFYPSRVRKLKGVRKLLKILNKVYKIAPDYF